METLKFKNLTLLQHPLFYVGLLIRLSILVIALPHAVITWYAPFMDLSTHVFTIDPWQNHLDSGGDVNSFPYGYVMWFALLPLTLLCKLLGIQIAIGYGITLFLVDVFLLLLIKRFSHVSDQLILIGYWLSPIIIFATYWLGFNDIIPVTILCCGLYALRARQPLLAGILGGAAISAKLSMLLAIPFFAIYLLRNPALKHLLVFYTYGLLTSLMLFSVPFLFSDAGLQMLLKNPEMQKTFDFALPINKTMRIYLLPLAYICMLYIAWQVRRITFDLFCSMLSIVFLLVLILSPAAPGWFVWFMPLVLGYLNHAKIIDFALVIGYSCLYLSTVFLSVDQPLVMGSSFASDIAMYTNTLIGARGTNLFNTGLLATGMILVYRIWREAIAGNDYFKLSRRPVVIGIAGDSGAGKDFLVDTIVDLFGKHSTVHISGDDYHLWDRHKPMWQVVTHLNPKANHLERFAKDLLALINGKAIMASHYDHKTGRKMPPTKIKSNDFVLASGLHTLHLPILRNIYDLSIYLDIDEGLRRHFKIERDVNVRGHALEKVLSSIEKREADSVKFIKPQADSADIIFKLKPNNQKMLDQGSAKQPIRLKLAVISRHSLNEESLKRILIGTCGLHVDMSLPSDKDEVVLTIEGEATGEDIALASRKLFPEMEDFLDASPKWHDGVSGLMQLIVLSHINQSLSKRLLI